MTYDKFIRFLKKNQTNAVKALTFINSCAVTPIPNAFLVLLADIVRFIHNHLEQFCKADQIVGIFGLQVTGCCIQSNLPQQLSRIGFPAYPQYHFCCTLNYLTLPKDNIEHVKSWCGYQSLVIDFTTGKIMNPEHLIYLLKFSPTQGKLYGELNPELLENAWRSVRKEHLKQKLALF